LSGAGFLPDLKGAGVEAKIDKKVTEARASGAVDLAPINLSIQDLKQALSKQEEFNKTLSASVDTLLETANPNATKVPEGERTAYPPSTYFSTRNLGGVCTYVDISSGRM
jgi:hypothetical protein